MPNPKDIKKAILKQAKKLDVSPKEAALVADVCAKHIARYYSDRKTGLSITKGIGALRVKAVKDKQGRKTIKVTRNEMKCMPREVIRLTKKRNNTLFGLLGKIWAEVNRIAGDPETKNWKREQAEMKEAGKSGIPQTAGAIRG